MTATSVQRFYRYHAYVYDKTRWLILHGRRQAVEALGLGRDDRVLEVGCGTGLNFGYVVERLDAGRGRLTGLDFSEPMLVKAQRRIEREGWPNVSVEQGDATQMRFDEPFDAILFSYSLTMIPDWAAAVDRADACLRPGGRLVVLDFSTFDGWGPLAPVARGWLRLNHVETRRPYVTKLERTFGDVRVSRWLGGYNFTAVAVRRGNGTSC